MIDCVGDDAGATVGIDVSERLLGTGVVVGVCLLQRHLDFKEHAPVFVPSAFIFKLKRSK